MKSHALRSNLDSRRSTSRGGVTRTAMSLCGLAIVVACMLASHVALLQAAAVILVVLAPPVLVFVLRGDDAHGDRDRQYSAW